MRVSAIRFGSDLWRLLEDEAARVGVSVVQYVREASLAGAAAAVVARGEDPLELLSVAALGAPRPAPAAGSLDEANHAPSQNLTGRVTDARSGAEALKAQSRQARRRAQELARPAKPSS